MTAHGNVEPDTAEAPLRRAAEGLDREAEARLWLENTAISGRTAWMLIACMLLTILFVPTVQFIREARAARSQSAGGRFPSFNIARLAPDASQTAGLRGVALLDAMLPTGEATRSYEEALEDGSVVGDWILPRAQSVLSGALGVGNEQVYKGLDNWLFYRADVDYSMGPGFLKAIHDRKSTRQADALRAIESFDRQLRARGIRLIVTPAVGKPTIHPDMISGRYRWNAPLAQNPSYAEFVRRLRSRGVLVFDTAEVLREARDRERRPQFLASDTHWTPAAVGTVAAKLGEFIGREAPLPSRLRAGFTRRAVRVTGIGDTAVMLKLPQGADARYRASVTTQQVSLNGRKWASDKAADVLFLGDSFSNIYSLKGMGWGESAGLAEQLSYRLGRPVDKISINAGGAHATRDALRREMARDPERLAGKRVVVYEFAARELSSGDWKLIDLPRAGSPRRVSSTKSASKTAPPAAAAPTAAAVPASNPEAPILTPDGKPAAAPAPVLPSKAPTPAKPTAKPQVVSKPTAKDTGSIVVSATVTAKAQAPEPGSAPYADCVIALHLTNVTVTHGKMTSGDIVVFIWGMRANKLTRAAEYAVGQRVTLTLKPWASVEPTYGSYNRVELEDDDLLMLDVFWGEEMR